MDSCCLAIPFFPMQMRQDVPASSMSRREGHGFVLKQDLSAERSLP